MDESAADLLLVAEDHGARLAHKAGGHALRQLSQSGLQGYDLRGRQVLDQLLGQHTQRSAQGFGLEKVEACQRSPYLLCPGQRGLLRTQERDDLIRQIQQMLAHFVRTQGDIVGTRNRAVPGAGDGLATALQDPDCL
jgi:hypothetical protein